MSGSEADRYRAWHTHWRAEAARLPPGQERDACEALAAGYADLLRFIECQMDVSTGPVVEASEAASQ